MRLSALAAAVALAAVVLLACGGGDSAPAAPASEPTTAPTETAADIPDDAVVSTTPRIYFIHTDW